MSGERIDQKRTAVSLSEADRLLREAVSQWSDGPPTTKTTADWANHNVPAIVRAQAIIARSVNSHAALVAALREWQEVAASLEGEPIRFDLHRTIRGALESGRASLKLAEGEEP